jgi:hypothetical protein
MADMTAQAEDPGSANAISPITPLQRVALMNLTSTPQTVGRTCALHLHQVIYRGGCPSCLSEHFVRQLGRRTLFSTF